MVTIAGTNGKGTCAAAVESLLLNAGKSVGVYNSPHIEHYNERVRLQGQEASDAVLIEAFEAIDRARGDLTLTYFEFGTLAALYCFKHTQCEYWILEVGLGGRLDATNIVDADIAVITSIGLDHCEWLGDTLESIGAEKAGICRPGKPVVCADPNPPQSVLNRIAELRCPYYALGQHFTISEPDAEPGVIAHHKGGFDKPFLFSVMVGGDTVPLETFLPSPSIAAALQVVSLLEVGDPSLWARSLQSLTLPGRFEQQLLGEQVWLFDVAHNAPAMQFLVAKIQRCFPGQKWSIVLGMMKDKHVQDCVSALSEIVSQWVLLPLEDNPRALTRSSLAGFIERLSPAPIVQAESNVWRCVDPLSENVLVTGSFFTVAEVKTELASRNLSVLQSTL